MWVCFLKIDIYVHEKVDIKQGLYSKFACFIGHALVGLEEEVVGRRASSFSQT